MPLEIPSPQYLTEATGTSAGGSQLSWHVCTQNWSLYGETTISSDSSSESSLNCGAGYTSHKPKWPKRWRVRKLGKIGRTNKKRNKLDLSEPGNKPPLTTRTMRSSEGRAAGRGEDLRRSSAKMLKLRLFRSSKATVATCGSFHFSNLNLKKARNVDVKDT